MVVHSGTKPLSKLTFCQPATTRHLFYSTTINSCVFNDKGSIAYRLWYTGIEAVWTFKPYSSRVYFDQSGFEMLRSFCIKTTLSE